MADQYLLKTFASAGNRKTFTFSVWLKQAFGLTSGNTVIFSAGSSSNTYCQIRMKNPNNYIQFEDEQGGSVTATSYTDAFFRDPCAWNHLVVRVDSTQSTASDRIRMYSNGTQLTLGGGSQPSQNQDFIINNNVGHALGTLYRGSDSGGHWNGNMAQAIFCDGQSLAPTSFASTNSDGVWVPNAGPSVTYGTNGFKIDFKGTGASADANGLGADSSGNNNHFATTNIGVNPSSQDSPDNNFAKMNPVDVGTNMNQTTFSEAGLKVASGGTTSDTGDQPVCSMGFSKGKWYWEIKGVSNPDNMFWGVFNDVLGGRKPYHENYFYGIYGAGTGSFSQIYESQEGNQKGYGTDSNPAFSNNDIIQMAFDCDNYRLYIGKNGLWTDDNAASGGTITSGSAFNQSTPTGYYQISTAAAQAGFYRPVIVKAGSSVQYTAQVNFGNPSFAITSGNADANGYGNFEYAVPSGYYALCTKNLAQYG